MDQSRCDYYLIFKTLGKGASSKVKLAQDSRTGEYVALKIFKAEERGKIKLETEVMETLKDHPNIIRLIEYIESGTYISKRSSIIRSVSYLALELASRGDIFDLISKLGKLPEPIARYYFKILLSAISAMHELGYAHRDIKPENILLFENFSIKLADLGFCGNLSGSDGTKLMRTFKGTRAYMAPELFERKPYDGVKADLFSSAIIGFILVTGRPPFMRAERMNTHYQHIANKNWRQFWKLHEEGEKLSMSFKDLMESMMAYYPKERLSISEILQHPWLTDKTATLPEVQEWILKSSNSPRSILSNIASSSFSKLSETMETFNDSNINIPTDFNSYNSNTESIAVHLQ